MDSCPPPRAAIRFAAGHDLASSKINELMGKDPSARFRFIMERGEEAVELDV